MTSIAGHNAPKMTIIDWIMDVMASEMKAAEKFVTIAAVVLQTASNDLLADACGIDKRTVVRSKGRPAKDGWIHIAGIESGGRGNLMTFSPGHPVYGPGVVFIYNEDTKDGQIATLLFSKFRDRSAFPTPKGWQSATDGSPVAHKKVDIGAANGGQIADVSNVTLSEKGDKKCAIGDGNAGIGAQNVEIGDKNEWQNAPLSRAPIRARAQKESLRDSLFSEGEVKGSEESPLTPQADVVETENDRVWKAAYLQGQRIKGGAVAKSARAAMRATGELDGSQGITLRGGKLTVANGAQAELMADFPGVDISAVCNRAAPEILRIPYPNFDQAMGSLRKWAEINVSDQKGRAPFPASRRSDGTRRPTVSELAEALEANEREKRQ